MPAANPLGQRLGIQLAGQCFGGAIDAVDIVAGFVKPVAYLFPGQAVVAGHAAGDPVVDELKPLTGASPRVMEADELVGEQGLLLDQAVEGLCTDVGSGEQRIGKRLAQQVLTALESQPSSAALDPSTAQLIARIRASRAGKK